MTASNLNSNQLKHASSPYLNQHADNPVNWQMWNENVLNEAKELGKPILLSIGYAACHWCHVMAHESFEDDETAQIMNSHFVNIKVDREERPDVDQIYMAALHATGEQGGWPLTMFLTPDAKPFWGGTYFPLLPSHGRPSFKQVLLHIAKAMEEQKEAIESNTDAMQAHLDKLNQSPEISSYPSKYVYEDFQKRTLQIYDPINGGMKGTPKFPNAPIVETWARMAGYEKNEAAAKAFIKTIERISNGGIYDHLKGGISRYTVDEKWLVPHFEKMLYDNAHYLKLLHEAYKLGNNNLFRNRIYETVDWLFDEMLIDDKAFASSIDADSEGIEGKFYVWDHDEILEILQDQHEEFCATYDVSPSGNWEGKNILNITNPNYLEDDDFSHHRKALLKARNKRIRPSLDDKILTDWNGYLIRSIAELCQTFDEPKWLYIIENAYRFICESNSMPIELNHSWREGVVVNPANTSDYASMINAALSLYETTQNEAYLDDCLNWINLLQDEYSDEAGGFYLTSKKVTDLITRPRSDQDEANPAGASVLLEGLTRYASLISDIKIEEMAQKLANNLYAVSRKSAYGMTGFMNALHSQLNQAHIIIFADKDSSLVKTAFEAPAWTRSISLNPSNLPDFMESQKNQDKEYAIVCKDRICSAPLFTPEELTEWLKT